MWESLVVLSPFISLGKFIHLLYKEFRSNHKLRKKLKQIGYHSRRRYFFPESLLKKLLISHDYEHLTQEKFIDESKGLCKEFYENEIMEINIRYNGEMHKKPLPYKEIINYTQNPDTSIKFAPALWGPKFELPADLDDATKEILYDFKKDCPDTQDNPAVGIHSLDSDGKGGYKCLLKKLTYFDAVRTNQTLDMPLNLPNQFLRTTMRQQDSGKSGYLTPLHQSLLANQIGISAIWYMHCPDESYKDRLQFFLKGRRSKLGIYSNMMGSICGTAQPPQGGFSKFKSLEEYATDEILRVFHQTTNIGQYLEDYAYPKQDLEITKLAFARELIRGGLPQFFFLIKTPYISEKEFAEYFRYSPENQKKYRNWFLSNALTPNIAPSIVVNFLFAFRHLQRDRHLDYIDLDD